MSAETKLLLLLLTLMALLICQKVAGADVYRIDPADMTNVVCTALPYDQGNLCGKSGYGGYYMDEGCNEDVIFLGQQDYNQDIRIRVGNIPFPIFPDDCPTSTYGEVGDMWDHLTGVPSYPPDIINYDIPDFCPTSSPNGTIIYVQSWMSRGEGFAGAWGAGETSVELVGSWAGSKAVLVNLRSKSEQNDGTHPGCEIPWCNGTVRVQLYEDTDDGGVMDPDGVYLFDTESKPNAGFYWSRDESSRGVPIPNWSEAFATDSPDGFRLIQFDSPDNGGFMTRRICVGDVGAIADLGHPAREIVPQAGIGGINAPVMHRMCGPANEEWHCHQLLGGFQPNKRPSGRYDERCLGQGINPNSCRSGLEADMNDDGIVDAPDLHFINHCRGHILDPQISDVCDKADFPERPSAPFPTGNGVVDLSDWSAVNDFVGWQCGETWDYGSGLEPIECGYLDFSTGLPLPPPDPVAGGGGRGGRRGFRR